MTTWAILKRWYGWVALLGWCLPFAIPAATMGVSLAVGRDLMNAWVGWIMLLAWVAASMWSFAVVPWLHALFLSQVGGDTLHAGQTTVSRWRTSAVVGVVFAGFPSLALTVLVYLLEYGPVYEPQWGAQEKRLALVLGLMGAGLAGVVMLKRRFGQRLATAYRRRGYCFGCGYNLRGLEATRCPECGGVDSEAESPTGPA